MTPRDYPWPVQLLIGAAFLAYVIAVALWQWATDWVFHRNRSKPKGPDHG